MTPTTVFPNLDAKRERFLRFNGPARLGNLASTLMRAADQAPQETGGEIAYRMLLEAQLFLSWDDTSRDECAQIALSDMKVGLERLQRRCDAATVWNGKLALEIAQKCRAYSDEALSLSGLLAE